MKITSIDIFQMGQPRNTETKPYNAVVVRINTDEGIHGFGEVGLAYGAGSSAGVGMLKDLSYFLLGENPENVEAIWEKLFRKTFWGMGGGPVVYGAMSAIDIACWDIKGKALGVPVHRLLGGKTRDKLRTYASQIQFGWEADKSLRLVQPEEYAEAALKAVSEGYDCVKVDPAGMTAEGVWGAANLEPCLSPKQLKLFYNRTKAVRDAVGSDVDIILEMHSYLGMNSARQFAESVKELGCLFYEEPIHPMSVDSMDRLARQSPIPLAGGERIYTRWGFKPFLDRQIFGLIQPDLGLCGGLTEGKKICDMANTHHVPVQCHVAGGPIALAAALQLESVIPNFCIHEHHGVALWEAGLDSAIHSYLPKDGFFDVPDLPGIGQELTEKAMSEALVHLHIEE
ncbi:mandelate racemase/muconate lactonizing enzyme family protein [Vibrio mangrovi]|uniref:D-galactonate dehydratase n=1 Tax=Vibrio mangrovi TaxID=474394 RepID=A0A1Y6IS99_9VIBR|nr:mandelate racemase/muconate lactonizing enzyme family protein [Vibrio mangrovi]MDW6003300.1 mandelate racemase/muconate lactonizing enzyme family protein [Vibrio mangrovi]SMR99911.1 D-galactonate dehydratase [Vibrio mangrovi]